VQRACGDEVCSGDLGPCARAVRTQNLGPCSCAAIDARRTARPTITGAWWRAALQRRSRRARQVLSWARSTQPARGVAQDDRVAGCRHPAPVALFPPVDAGGRRRCHRVRLSELSLPPRQWAPAGCPAVVAAARTRQLLAPEVGPCARQHAVAEGAQDTVAYRLIDPVRVAAAPPVVRRQRDGRPAGLGLALAEKNTCTDAWTGSWSTRTISSSSSCGAGANSSAQVDVLLYDLTSTYFETDEDRGRTTCASSATAATSG